MSGNGKHFVLVHGSCHGAWCWFRLQPLLEAAGHQVTTIDLAAAGTNPLQWCSLLSISDYFQPLFSFFEALPEGERVILVGHSKGGLAISTAMEKYPNKVCVGVFATAYMLGPTFNILDLNKIFFPPVSFFSPDTTITYDDQCRFTSMRFGNMFMEENLYQLSPREDWILATMLARPYPFHDDERGAKELELTQENYGSIKRVFIRSENDTSMNSIFVPLFLEKTPPDEVLWVYGSDHMLMFSQPEQLCNRLLEIENRYA